MTDLQKMALAGVPLIAEAVETIYNHHKSLLVKGLCQSHERLRAELQGAELLLSKAEARVAELESVVRKCKAAQPVLVCESIFNVDPDSKPLVEACKAAVTALDGVEVPNE